jgi:hypothetical protein
MNYFALFRISFFVGEIIYWGLVRFALVLIAAWLLYSDVPNYGEWWMFFFVAVTIVVIYPAQLAFRKHTQRIQRASENALCATCRYLAPDEALCTKLDEHVRSDYTPCDGEGWDPK